MRVARRYKGALFVSHKPVIIPWPVITHSPSGIKGLERGKRKQSCPPPPPATRHSPSAVIHQLLSEDTVGQHGEFLIAAKGSLHTGCVNSNECIFGTAAWGGVFLLTQNPKGGRFILRIARLSHCQQTHHPIVTVMQTATSTRTADELIVFLSLHLFDETRRKLQKRQRS